MEQEYKPGFSPCGHRIVVFPIPTERKTESGIILGDASASREDMKQIEAVVIEVGSTAYSDQPQQRPWCKAGDRVLLAAYAGLYREGSDKKAYRIISDLDVVAVLHHV